MSSKLYVVDVNAASIDYSECLERFLMTVSQMIGDNTLIPIKFQAFGIKEKDVKLALANTALDDFALIQRMTQGDEAALGVLYDRYGRLIFSVAYGVVQNRETAEEVTLDIFTRAWEMADKYDPKQAKVTTWLTRMARNLAIDRLRREKVRPLHHSVSWSEVTVEPIRDRNQPETAVQLSLAQQRVRQAVASLPPAQQEALALAYFQGYSHGEIAQVLDQPLGTVKGRIRAAMKKLQTLLKDEHESQSHQPARSGNRPK